MGGFHGHRQTSMIEVSVREVILFERCQTNGL